MRAFFGLAALLVTLAVVGLLARRQLHPAVVPAAVSAPGVPGTAGDTPVAPADPLQAPRLVQDGLAAAAAEAQRRNDAADKAD